MAISVALIGYGYWGRNVARTLLNSAYFTLKTIYDEDKLAQNEGFMQCEKISRELDSVNTLVEYPNFKAILDDENIESIFIITPPHTHFHLAKIALEAGKHIFVEKPITTDFAQAQMLFDIAESKNLILYCNHIFLHSPAVNYLKEHIKSFGEIVYINARRINLGLFQSNVDVIWDLAIHDLSIIDYLVGLDIHKVSTFTTKYLDYPNDALANINIELESGIVVMISVSWISPIKVREMLLGGSKKSAIYDEVKRDKITLFDSGVVIKDKLDKTSLYQKMVEYKLGAQEIPHIPQSAPLDNSIAFFARLILKQNTESKNDKAHILRVMKALSLIESAL